MKVKALMMSSDMYPPWRIDVTKLLGEQMVARGHQVDCILQAEEEIPGNLVAQWQGGQVFAGRTNTGTSLFSRVFKHLLAMSHDLSVFGKLRAGDYNCLIVKDKFVSGMIGLVAAQVYKVPFVFWLSWPFPEDYLDKSARADSTLYRVLYYIRGKAYENVLYRWLLPKANHIFVQSQQMKRDVCARVAVADKTTPVPMGVEDELLAQNNRPEDLLNHGKSFLYLGTLDRMRRLSFLVEVLAKVRNLVPGVKLYIVGGGNEPEDEAEILDAAQRLQVEDDLVMLGLLPREKALDVVKQAGVCVSPFYPTPVLNSTSPTKLLEYMALEMPVVANDHPDQRQVLEESGAGLCVQWDADEFADAIATLLNDPQMAAQMGRRGRPWVQNNRSYSMLIDDVEAALCKSAGQAVTPVS